MRKLLIYSFVLLFAISLVSAASVSRSMAARIAPGEDLTVTFSVTGAEVGKTFTLEDTVPEGWAFKSWEVTGSQEAKSAINHRFVENKRHGWSFTASSSSIQITYVLGVPAGAEQKAYPFSATWFDPSGFNKEDSSTTVRVIRCGDSVCESAENSDNCESDCPKPAPPVQTTPAPEPETEPEPAAPETGFNPLFAVLLVLVLVAIGAVYFLFVRKHN